MGPYFNFSDEEKLEARHRLARIEQALAEPEEVLAIGFTGNVPYGRSNYQTTTYLDGEPTSVRRTLVRPGSRDVLGWEVIEGRWLQEGDEVLDVTPIVITQDLAEGHFGNESAVGQLLPSFDDDGNPEEAEAEDVRRIVGVVRDVRVSGELEPAQYSLFELFDYEASDDWPPRSFLLRVAPGTTAALEEELMEIAQRHAPEWTFTLDRLEDMRAERLREALLPLGLMAVVAGFLILMVGLGLIGVLWQNVVRRRSEIGLRRALGATAGGVCGQILGELLALTTLAVILGTAIYLQFPLLGILREGWAVVALALGAALAVLYGFVLLCGLYPSWLATRVEPARALMYE
jgi:putative ABC transport system permease protein